MEVSIIIPVYNGEKTLRQCLNSVLNQTYENYEVIVVDNNSTDKTKDIIKEFQDKSRKMKYLFEPQRGRGAARNTGERTAKGNIVLMTDSDCIVPNDWIRHMIKPIINEGYDAVQGFESSATKDFWSRHQQLRSEEKFRNFANPKKIDLLKGSLYMKIYNMEDMDKNIGKVGIFLKKISKVLLYVKKN